MTTEKWSNQSTMIVYRWLTQENNLRNQLQVLADNSGNNIATFALEIEELVTDVNNPLAGHYSVYAELIELAFKEVNWQDIAGTFLANN